jgi:hypothetical protein
MKVRNPNIIQNGFKFSSSLINDINEDLIDIEKSRENVMYWWFVRHPCMIVHTMHQVHAQDTYAFPARPLSVQDYSSKHFKNSTQVKWKNLHTDSQYKGAYAVFF